MNKNKLSLQARDLNKSTHIQKKPKLIKFAKKYSQNCMEICDRESTNKPHCFIFKKDKKNK